MLTTVVVDAQKLDPIPYSGPARFNLNNELGSYYITLSFCNKVKTVTHFDKKFFL